MCRDEVLQYNTSVNSSHKKNMAAIYVLKRYPLPMGFTQNKPFKTPELERHLMKYGAEVLPADPSTKASPSTAPYWLKVGDSQSQFWSLYYTVCSLFHLPLRYADCSDVIGAQAPYISPAYYLYPSGVLHAML